MAEAKTISILDIEFNVSMPYDAGHTINEAEAKVLNQTRRENLGNNFRSLVKAHVEGEEGAKTLEELQAEFVKRDSEYVFTLASAAASVKYTPEEREARKIARDYIKQQLDANGQKIGTPPEGQTQEAWNDAIEGEVARIALDPQVVKMAKDIVKARSKTAGLTLGAVLGQPETTAGETAGEGSAQA